jgi:molybdopterin-guanine dinucleotide biosynthesis protein A
MMTADMRTGAIILCGGESKRMGRPKAWLPIGDEVLLQRLVRIVGEAVSPVVVVAAGGQALPPLPAKAEVVRDAERGRGPLQGMLAGLEAVLGRVDAVFASSCDVPFLRPAFIRRLIDLRGECWACVPQVHGRKHPLAAVYSVEVVPTVQRLLNEDCLRATSLVDGVPTRLVEAAELREVDADLDSLRNVNTAEEYEEALRKLRSQ